MFDGISKDINSLTWIVVSLTLLRESTAARKEIHAKEFPGTSESTDVAVNVLQILASIIGPFSANPGHGDRYRDVYGGSV